jgi:hypothetical protein
MTNNSMRRWNVRFYMRGTLLAELIVEAPSKVSAHVTACQRVAHDQWERFLATDKVTASPMARDEDREAQQSLAELEQARPDAS